jgi:hypothetical protein
MPAALLLLALACGGSPPASEGSEGSESSTQSDASETNSAESSVMDEPDLPQTCEPLAQDCPDGQKCVPHQSDGGLYGTNKCVPVLGDGAPGEPCTPGTAEETDDCDASSVCWYLGESGGVVSGTCQPLCTGSPEQPSCPDGWYCSDYGDDVRYICEWMCDPIAQNCADGEACYGSNTEDFLCLNAGNRPAGEWCSYTNDCAPGVLCLPTCAGESCCTGICDLELGNAQCDAVPGTECVSLYEGQPPAGFENVGICVAP